MKLNYIKLIVLTLLLLCTAFSPLCAQTSQEPPDVPPPEPVCTQPAPLRAVIKGCILGGTSTSIIASGNVRFQQGHKRLLASDINYNTVTGQGILHNAYFTTCDARNPDYHITAREVVILPNNRLKLRGAALYLGRTRIFALPSLLVRIGGRGANTAIFPRPGFDAKDGFTLSQSFRFIDTVRNWTSADIRLTTNSGVQGEIADTWGLDGTLQDYPGRFLSYESLRSSVLNLPQEPVDQQCNPQDLRPIQAARTRVFGRFGFRQRTYSVINPDLVLSREPELGISYIGPQIYLNKQKIDPRLEIHSEASASWGRYKEDPGLESFTGRSNFTGVAAVNALSLGPQSTLQPIGYLSYSHYQTGDNYTIWAYALDASHLWPTGSFASLRYINRSDVGHTPFLFDKLDISREMQGAFKLQIKRDTVGLVTRYDLNAQRLYEWEAFYGHRFDCIRTWVRWNNRLRRLALDVTLVNLP